MKYLISFQDVFLRIGSLALWHAMSSIAMECIFPGADELHSFHLYYFTWHLVSFHSTYRSNNRLSYIGVWEVVTLSVIASYSRGC